LTDRVFIGGELLLDVSFDVARDRLISLIRGGSLLTASQDAYGDGVAGLARVGPLGPGPGVSRLVEVKFREPVTHGDSVTAAMRWEAIGPSGGLFPALDADLTLAPAEGGATVLRLAAAYRPPLGALGVQLDRVILHRVASVTVHAFLRRVGTAITHPGRPAVPVSK
jgi:hypothetical protein